MTVLEAVICDAFKFVICYTDEGFYYFVYPIQFDEAQKHLCESC